MSTFDWYGSYMEFLKPVCGESHNVAPKCECGAEKCRSNIHSSWCPKAAK